MKERNWTAKALSSGTRSLPSRLRPVQQPYPEIAHIRAVPSEKALTCFPGDSGCSAYAAPSTLHGLSPDAPGSLHKVGERSTFLTTLGRGEGYQWKLLVKLAFEYLNRKAA